eukprot:5382_1
MGNKQIKLKDAITSIFNTKNDEEPISENKLNNEVSSQRLKTDEEFISIGYTGEYIDASESTPKHILLLGNNEHNDMTLQYDNISYAPDIRQICSGNGYTIYCNHEKQEYYACGNNRQGQCGIDGIKIKLGNNEYLKPAKIDNLSFSAINYFKHNRIRIKKVCTNVVGSCTFWISENNKLYANGDSCGYKLGTEMESCLYPYLIQDLKDVIDVKSNPTLSMALCGMDSCFIVIGFARNVIDDTFIPNDIWKLISAFYGKYKYCKIFVSGTHHSLIYINSTHINSIKRWRQMTAFARKNKQIVKIDCTLNTFICLESNGTVWRCDSLNEPVVMQFRIHCFSQKNIKIKDIACGAAHLLAIDDYNRMFIVGGNMDHKMYTLIVPELVDLQLFGGRRVMKIKCGWNYSYIMTEDYMHFLMCKGEVIMLNSNIGKDLKHISLGPNNIKMIFNREVDMEFLFDTDNPIDMNTNIDRVFDQFFKTV